MASEVSICNLSLTAIGASPITALTDAAAEAVVCRAHYEVARDATLFEYPWPEAVGRASLAMLAAGPAYKYAYAYALPADCLRVLAIDDDRTDWKVEGQTLVTNNSTVYVRYIKKLTDPNAFGPALLSAIAARLAAEVVMPLTGSRSLFADMWKVYDAKLRMAQSATGMQGSGDAILADSLLVVR